MPFMETCRMEERVRMLTDWDSGNWSVAELCRRYGVCRDTFYAWQKRRASGEAAWSVDRSHAARHCPHRTGPAVAAAIVALRRRWPHLGPRKLLAVLARDAPATRWPAASTIGDILKQAQLVAPVKRRRRALDQPRRLAAVMAANDEWATDFKGWFRTQDHSRIDPLTITDSHSRLLIDVRITAPTIAGVQPVFVAAFCARGLPRAIRCDNGGAVRLDRRRRPHPAVGVVAQARDRAALHPSGRAAGERPPRAHASHAQGADLASAGGDGG